MTGGLTASDVFPSLRALVLVEVDTVSHTTRAAGEKLIVPGFCSGSQSLESLWVAEAMNQFILSQVTNAGFKIFDSGLMNARGHHKAGETEDQPGWYAVSKYGLQVVTTSTVDPTVCSLVI